MGLKILHLHLHGLIRSNSLELGRDPDTGGQTLYVLELVKGLAARPEVEKVELNTKDTLIPNEFLDDIFSSAYGNTLNLNDLQKRINLIKKWYEDNGYSLARINGPDRISEDGSVTLNIIEGKVSKIKTRFVGKDGEVKYEKDGITRRKGKTKDWVIKIE